jgi:hypothetical protein
MIAAALPATAAAGTVSTSGGFKLPSSMPKAGSSVDAPIAVPGPVAQIAPDGRTAVPPGGAPEPVKQAIYAANQITRTPYRYGGGHGAFVSRAYDCSGAVSFALHGGNLLQTPLDSSAFMRWGERGPGAWITVYTKSSHAFAVLAGLRFDTSGPGERGPRWRPSGRSTAGFKLRHFPGL